MRTVVHPAVKKMPAIGINGAFEKIRVMELSQQILCLMAKLVRISVSRSGSPA